MKKDIDTYKREFEQWLDKRMRFSQLLDIYGLPKEVDWENFIINEIDFINISAYKEELGDEDICDLLQLIKMFTKHKTIVVSGQAEKLEIRQGNLQKWLLLSLHTLLDKALPYHYEKDDDERLYPFLWGTLSAMDIDRPCHYDGYYDGFVEAFPDDTIEDIHKLYQEEVAEKRIREGRNKLDYVHWGCLIMECVELMPEIAIQQMNKTDVFNFCGDVLELTGQLDQCELWNNVTNELRNRPANMITGDLRKQRKKMVENWIKQAIKYFNAHPDIRIDGFIEGYEEKMRNIK